VHAAIDIRDRAALEAAISAQPRIDAVVNCVGDFHIGPFEATAVQTWRDLLSTNTTALWSVCRLSLPKLRAGGGIVNVASRGYLGSPQLSAYGASKAAVVGLTRALAMELVPRRISVNAIAPGMIDTPLLHASLDAAGFAAAQAQQPGGHIGRPEDVAETIAYFLRAAPFVTGQVVCVDGGKSVTTAYVG
jgi:3-oxoacyl-[acyl-carrier protein] reductase